MPLLTVLLPHTARGTTPLTSPAGTPAAVFAREAGIAGDLVTVNVIEGARQTGNAYGAVVGIVVPDAWDAKARQRFLLAAAVMLERCFAVPTARAIVTISRVPSGSVLDRGVVETW